MTFINRLIRIPQWHVAASLVSLLAAASQAHAVTNEELAKKLDALEKQNAALQAKVEKLEAAQATQSRHRMASM